MRAYGLGRVEDGEGDEWRSRRPAGSGAAGRRAISAVRSSAPDRARWDRARRLPSGRWTASNRHNEPASSCGAAERGRARPAARGALTSMVSTVALGRAGIGDLDDASSELVAEEQVHQVCAGRGRGRLVVGAGDAGSAPLHGTMWHLLPLGLGVLAAVVGERVPSVGMCSVCRRGRSS